MLIFKQKISRISCFVFSLAALFYIQGNILVWDYGLMDGHAIIWNDYLIIGIVEIIIWVSIIGISQIKHQKLYKFIALASAFIFLIQIVGLIALVYLAPPEPQWKSYFYVDGGSSFNVSDSNNVIIIVLDTFQSDVFQEIIDSNSEYAIMFDGFTYYRNTLGGFPTTIGSVPMILTGTYYNNSAPFQTYIKNTYLTSSLPKTLKDNGYKVDIYEDNHFVYPSSEIASNVQEYRINYYNEIQTGSISLNSQSMRLYKLTIFRHVPHFFKELSYPYLFQTQFFSERPRYDILSHHSISNEYRHFCPGFQILSFKWTPPTFYSK